MKESTITFIINDNKENKIKFGKIKYKNREATYKKIINPSKEEQKLQFEYNKYSIKYKKLKRFLNRINDNTINYFSKINLREELLIKIKIKEDSINNKKIIYSEYFIDEEFLKDKKPYQDKYILKHDNYLEGFKSFLEEIIKQKQESINIASTQEASINIQKNNYLSLIKPNGKIKKFAKKIWELDDGSLVADGIIEYDIKEFNQNEKKKLNNYENILTGKKAVNIKFKNESISLNKKPDNNIPNIKELYPCRNLLILRNINYIIYNGTIYSGSDIFNPLNKEKIFFILSEKAYIGGIKLNNDYIAFTSNRILSKGENKLYFYSSKSQKFMEEFEIKNYSFTFSQNNCSVMRIPENENIKLLFVACKKYCKDDKNGILLIKLKFNKDELKKKYEKFYDTKNFEVYCFCQLFEVKNMKDNDQKIETKYFLIGGFDIDKREGIIKLYKVIYYDEIEKIEIEFMQDIIKEKKEGEKVSECSKGPISCIIHSPQIGILVTCYDGNVYIFPELIIEKMKEIEERVF